MKLKIKFIILLFIFKGLFFFCQNNNSFIIIKGTTNINTFKCINDNFYQLIPISLENSDNKFSETSVNLIVKDFDCSNKIMTADFRNTLHADKYPFLSIIFLTLDKTSTNKFKAYVQVKMINKIKKYYIDFTLADNKLIGNKTLHFTDFGITPPKKYGGLIVVKDDLELSFSLNVK